MRSASAHLLTSPQANLAAQAREIAGCWSPSLASRPHWGSPRSLAESDHVGHSTSSPRSARAVAGGTIGSTCPQLGGEVNAARVAP